MSRATVGKRYQVVIPLKEREKLNIKPNTKVEVIAEGDRLIIYPLSPSQLRGIGKKIANKADPTDYVQRLRSEWERNR